MWLATGEVGRDGEDTEGSGGGSKEDLRDAALGLRFRRDYSSLPAAAAAKRARGGTGNKNPGALSTGSTRRAPGSPQPLPLLLFWGRGRPDPGALLLCRGLGAAEWVFLCCLLSVSLHESSSCGDGQSSQNPSAGLRGAGLFPSPPVLIHLSAGCLIALPLPLSKFSLMARVSALWSPPRPPSCRKEIIIILLVNQFFFFIFFFLLFSPPLSALTKM